ncbi:roadblock/LC7 domain-containing protein [bacterium]|nr:roadblock/LC7 domain-containing protein [bacterium]
MANLPERNDLYAAVHDCLLALLGRDGVLGVVLLDGEGRLILHEGREPQGDVEALAASRLAAARRVDGVLDPEGRHHACLLTDARHTVYLTRGGAGTVLLAYLEPSVPAGLAHRLLDVDAGRLADLLDAALADEA